MGVKKIFQKTLILVFEVIVQPHKTHFLMFSSETKIMKITHSASLIFTGLKSVFSQSMYLPPVGDAHTFTNKWTAHFTSAENRHALPLFTSLLNFVCSYDPAGILPYNHLIFQVSSMFISKKKKLYVILNVTALPGRRNRAGPGREG